VKLFIIGSVLYVREIGSESKSEDVSIQLPGIADGTEITVVRTSDNKYQISRFANGEARIKREFLLNSRYRIKLSLPSGAKLACDFECKEGALFRVWRGNDIEIGELWRALIYLVESRKDKDDKLDRLITGYTSE